ncbi:MAG: TIGR02147 family protein [Chitinivibrionales bacterium]|nr:TIGR02147 family protein [Chitinivibrionales bacterium]
MTAIFEYLDYRTYLRDAYEFVKKEKPFFSYRYISGRVGINPGYIVKVFQGKVHLGLKNVPAFADLFGLQDKERDFFTELVHFGRAKNQREIEMRFKRLGSIKGIRFRTVADDQAEFYRQWYHMAIRSLLSIYPFDGSNYRALASKLTPHITAEQARESLGLLERLKLIAKDNDGIYQVTEQFITTGEKWNAGVIRDYQKANIELGVRALEQCTKDLRDISTVTMSFSQRDLPALRERVAQFRQELLRMSDDCTGEDSVMQLNISFFPVALLGKNTEAKE